MRKHLTFPHLLSLLTSRWLTIFLWLDYYHAWRDLVAPYPILGTFRRTSSLFLEVPLAQGVTFWVPTQAPQVSVTYPGSVSTFLSHHAPGSSLGITFSWVVSIPGSTLMALVPWPWSHLSLHFITVSELGGPEAPWRHSLHGLSYPWVSGSNTAGGLLGDTLSWRRLV